ncbi:MAG: hypothetical protein ACO32I_04940 [Candidatus Limnocylindrus sp.]|jgi:hypothetical protein
MSITIEQITSDVRQLALELNNLAITLSALIEVTGVDRARLQAAGKAIFDAAVAEVEAEAARAQQAQTPPPSAEQHISENLNVAGQPSHPANAVFFGG